MKTIEAFQSYILDQGIDMPYDDFAVWWASEGLSKHYLKVREFWDDYVNSMRTHGFRVKTDDEGRPQEVWHKRIGRNLRDDFEFMKNTYISIWEKIRYKWGIARGKIREAVDNLEKYWKIIQRAAIEVDRRFDRWARRVKIFTVVAIVGIVLVVTYFARFDLHSGSPRYDAHDSRIVKQIITSQGYTNIVYDRRIEIAINNLALRFNITDRSPFRHIIPSDYWIKARIPDSDPGEHGSGGEEQFEP